MTFSFFAVTMENEHEGIAWRVEGRGTESPFLPAESELLAEADLLPNTDSKSTLRPLEVCG